VLIDSHCHLDFPIFDLDRQLILDGCKALGINKLIIPGTQASGWAGQVTLAQQYPQLSNAFGLHPYFLNAFDVKHIANLDEYLTRHKAQVVALGEVGLDLVVNVDWQLQLWVFKQQVELAKVHSLPLILHHRKSHNQLIKTLKEQQFTGGGIVHAFSGSLQQAQSYIELGFKIGVGGGITYSRANKTRLAISQLPLSSLVLETDAPDMPLMGKQGQRNTPENLPDILFALCQLRTESKAQVRDACRHNVEQALKHI
jgi:TatD DNase family protein